MPRNGSGTYTLPAGNPVVTGTTISSTTQNNTMSDVATALTASIAKDGQTTPTANLPMGTYRHTGVGNGVARTDYTSLGQTQDGLINWADAGGTADALTATYTPVVTALSDGQLCYVRAAAANATTTPTFSPNSLTARTIVKTGGIALAAGDIVGDGHELILRYDLTNTKWELLNPGTITNSTNAINVTGTIASGVTGTTQSAADNSTKIATTAYVDRVKDKLFDIDASVGSNALTVTINPCVLDFRSTTLTDGTPVTRTISAAINMTVSSGSTLGTVNAVQSDIAILAIDNAGTVEVAVVNIAGGTDLSETGLISTIAEGGAGAADSASIIYSTTARTNVAYRVLGIVRSTQATAGTWATDPSLVQGAGGNIYRDINSYGLVKLYTANGYGSTNTGVRRFTTVQINIGTDITYTDSSTLGGYFTINKAGTYLISYTDNFASLTDMSISRNATSTLNGVPTDIAEVLAEATASPTSGSRANCTAVAYLNAGDIIRAQTGGTAASNTRVFFSISRVA